MTSPPAGHPDPTAVSTLETDVVVNTWWRRRRQVGVAFTGDTLQAQAR